MEEILAIIPEQYLPYAVAVWALLFYVVSPLVKRFAKPGSLLVRVAEWLSQDTHRPPAQKKLEPVPPPAP